MSPLGNGSRNLRNAEMSLISHRLFTCVAVVAIVGAVLSGCAAGRAYRDGRELIANGKVEEGLTKFREAMIQDPSSLDYKIAYLQTRERAIFSNLEQADRFFIAGRRSDAEKLYRIVLVIDSGNERALAGLKNVDIDVRHEQLINDAVLAVGKKNFDTAKLKVSLVLSENPSNNAARDLQRVLSEQSIKLPIETFLSEAYKKSITIEFKDVAIKQVFEVISRTSGLNFLFDKDVKADQKTSIFLKNSNVEAAVHFTLLTNQLEQQILDRNTILIYPNTAAKQKDYQEMVIKTFFLTNTDAKAMANTLKTIVKTRDIAVDEKLNMIIVRDTPESIRLAEKIVSLQDVAEPEVMLEVEILEVKRTRLLELGIRWPASLDLAPVTSATGVALTLNDLRTAYRNPSGLGTTISPISVKLRKEDGDTNILANPRIRARNHEKAKILIGERVPNITTTSTATGFVSESITYVDVGLKLDVEPTVYLDNDVAIKISLEVSNIVNQLKTQTGSVAYQIGTRTASTVLRLKDGENQVLAGLINDEDRRNGNKIPALGDIPIIGRLFGSSSDNNQKTEIVLSITPHLIRNIQRPDAALLEFRSGTDNSFRMRPDSVSATLISTTSNNDGASAPQNRALSSRAPVNDANANIASATSNLTGPSSIGSGIPNNAVAPNTGAQITWQGPAQAKIGNNFELALLMQSNQPIVSLPIAISFDNQALQVVNLAEGDFLKQGGVQTTFTSQVDPAGQILIAATRSAETGATASGVVARITFRALSGSSGSLVQLVKIAPVGVAGRSLLLPLPINYSVQIQP